MKSLNKLIKLLILSGLFFANPLFAASKICPADGIYVQVLGAGGPELNDNLASTGYAIWDNGKIRVLVDTGTGSAEHFGATGQAFNNVELILYSHFHTDHSADFPALIKNAFFEGRTRDLQIYGPTGNQYLPSTDEFVQRMIGKQGAFPYLSGYLTGEGSYQIHTTSVTPTDKPQTFVQNGIRFRAIDAEHGPLPSLAWSVEIHGKSVTFSGDNGGHSDYLAQLAKNTRLLVAHNAVPENAVGVARRLHMPPSRIGEIAKAAKANKLLLSHFMNRTRNSKDATLANIKQYYQGSVIISEAFGCYRL